MERGKWTADWQDIETAPRDGTVILLRSPVFDRFEVEAAYWNLAPKVFGTDPSYPWTLLDPTNGTNGRSDDRGGPTHWAPLPDPALRLANGEPSPINPHQGEEAND